MENVFTMSEKAQNVYNLIKVLPMNPLASFIHQMKDDMKAEFAQFLGCENDYHEIASAIVARHETKTSSIAA